MKILIAEDDIQTSNVFRKLLDNKGNVVITSNGIDCLKKYKESLGNTDENPYDLVLVDFAMPKLDGIHVIEEIKRIRPSQKIILVTAYTREIISKIPSKLKISFLQKPFTLNTLLETISEQVVLK